MYYESINLAAQVCKSKKGSRYRKKSAENKTAKIQTKWLSGHQPQAFPLNGTLKVTSNLMDVDIN